MGAASMADGRSARCGASGENCTLYPCQGAQISRNSPFFSTALLADEASYPANVHYAGHCAGTMSVTDDNLAQMNATWSQIEQHPATVRGEVLMRAGFGVVDPPDLAKQLPG